MTESALSKVSPKILVAYETMKVIVSAHGGRCQICQGQATACEVGSLTRLGGEQSPLKNQ
ncbi:hypothetical protein ACNFJN_19090 [Xenorhabdus budapestensis]|uniref:hypothetical protein n=1 Tax=Xenorhabdus budapestensis TaxID=290110 RepID=UPI003A8577BD